MLPHQAGVVCLAAGRLLSVLLDERHHVRGRHAGVVEVLPFPDAGEAAVGELPQQFPDPLRLGPPQCQVILRLDQEEPWYLGNPRLQPRLVLGDGRVQRVQPSLEQADQLVRRQDGALAEGRLEPGVLTSGSLISWRTQSFSSSRPASVIW